MRIAGYCLFAALALLGVLGLGSTPACAQPGPDVVVCELQPPNHPPNYWYSVTPVVAGRCDFHVQVFDSEGLNYTGWIDPPGWVHALHFANGGWWVSWWSPDCAAPIYTPFTCGFTNTTAATWGNWTTTLAGTNAPYPPAPADLVDSGLSAAHANDTNGFGRLVHVPEGPSPAEERSWGAIKATYR
jgi:hypothetical protein